jgi:hypothetical protein
MVLEANYAKGLQDSWTLTTMILIVGVASHFVAADEPKRDEELTVVCVDKDGKPVTGAEVHLFQCVVGEPTRFKHFGPFESDEQGRATCQRTVVYDVQGHFDRWAYAHVTGRLVGVARSTNWKNRKPINAEFRVDLQPSRSVEGQVTVPEGFDPAQVIVHTQVLHIKTGPRPFDFQSFPRHLPFEGLDTALADVFDKRPDAQGRIRFDDVPVHGSLYLLTAAEGLGEAQWRNNNQSFDEPIRLAINKEAILTGNVVSPDGKPAAGITVSARLSITPQTQVFHLTTFRAQTDVNGRFVIHGLPQTPFVLSVDDPTHQWLARPREGLQIASGESKDVDISMEVGIVVSGRVLDPKRNPVEGAALSAVTDSNGGPGLADDMTDREGRYRLRLPSGGARLYFNSLPNGFAYPDPQVVKELDLKTGQDPIEGLDFTLLRKANDDAAGRSP